MSEYDDHFWWYIAIAVVAFLAILYGGLIMWTAFMILGVTLWLVLRDEFGDDPAFKFDAKTGKGDNYELAR